MQVIFFTEEEQELRKLLRDVKGPFEFHYTSQAVDLNPYLDMAKIVVLCFDLDIGIEKVKALLAQTDNKNEKLRYVFFAQGPNLDVLDEQTNEDGDAVDHGLRPDGLLTKPLDHDLLKNLLESFIDADKPADSAEETGGKESGKSVKDGSIELPEKTNIDFRVDHDSGENGPLGESVAHKSEREGGIQEIFDKTLEDIPQEDFSHVSSSADAEGALDLEISDSDAGIELDVNGELSTPSPAEDIHSIDVGDVQEENLEATVLLDDLQGGASVPEESASASEEISEEPLEESGTLKTIVVDEQSVSDLSSPKEEIKSEAFGGEESDLGEFQELDYSSKAEGPAVTEEQGVQPDFSQKGSSQSSQVNVNFGQDDSTKHSEIKREYEIELARLSETIRVLREEREFNISRVQKLEKENIDNRSKLLSSQSELDELKIELSLIKTRSNKEVERLKNDLALTEEKLSILKNKNKMMGEEVHRSSQIEELELRKIKERENELEEKMELIKMDSDSQLKSREEKIIELKRKIDSLEFELTNITNIDRKHKNLQLQLENKIDVIFEKLKEALKIVESDPEELAESNDVKKVS